MPHELDGTMPIRAFNVAMVADRVISEQENAFICDGCMKDILDPRECAVCQKTSHANDQERKTKARAGA